jgi:hypothetical protein
LLAAGLDPNLHGFSVDSKLLRKIKQKFIRGHWEISENEVFMWTDIQKRLGNVEVYVIKGLNDFFAWLEKVDFEELSMKSKNSRRIQKRARKGLKEIIVSILYKA